MTRAKGFSVIIPVYNEGRSIRKTVESILAVFKKMERDDFEILPVNDGSKDNSLEILQSITSPFVKVTDHTENMGYGSALKSGIKRAKYDHIIITDADGTYPVEDIPRLIRYIDDYDMVVGSRTGRKVNIPLIRRPAKFMLNLFASYLAGRYIPDLNSGLRIFRKDIALKYWALFPKGFSFTSTITMCCLTNGYAVKYVPINYFKRVGKSSIHPIKDTIRFFELTTRLSLYFNPMRIFFPTSLLFFVAGALRGWRDYLLVDHLGGLSLILFFIAFQIFFFGMVATIISKRVG